MNQGGGVKGKHRGAVVIAPHLLTCRSRDTAGGCTPDTLEPAPPPLFSIARQAVARWGGEGKRQTVHGLVAR